MNCANHPDRERTSFCQNCGKPLCLECSRTVGAGVFCEPCLAARLAGVNTRPGSPFTTTAAGIPIPVANAGPNPALAAILGFIPGVGAMYNGQYAKGVVHLVIFAVLVSLADSNGIFGLFVAGWEFYMAFESYHTARARRYGTPLPNPFGLNDIGERFGFDKSWMPATGTPVAPVTPVTPPPASAEFQFSQDAAGNQVYSASDGTVFTQSRGGAQTYTDPHTPPPPGWRSATSYGQPYAYSPTPTAAYAPVTADTPYAATPSPNRFPAGAVWLIALGLLFFFGSSGVLRGFPVQRLLPFLLIGLGIWLFIRKMTAAGQTLEDDGSTVYRQRLFGALRSSVWVILVGVLFLLDSFNILSWGRSWPLFIIVAGLTGLLQRYAYAPPAPGLPYVPASAPPVPPTHVASTEIIPTQEGR